MATSSASSVERPEGIRKPLSFGFFGADDDAEGLVDDGDESVTTFASSRHTRGGSITFGSRTFRIAGLPEGTLLTKPISQDETETAEASTEDHEEDEGTEQLAGILDDPEEVRKIKAVLRAEAETQRAKEHLAGMAPSTRASFEAFKTILMRPGVIDIMNKTVQSLKSVNSSSPAFADSDVKEFDTIYKELLDVFTASPDETLRIGGEMLTELDKLTDKLMPHMSPDQAKWAGWHSRHANSEEMVALLSPNPKETRSLAWTRRLPPPTWIKSTDPGYHAYRSTVLGVLEDGAICGKACDADEMLARIAITRPDSSMVPSAAAFHEFASRQRGVLAGDMQDDSSKGTAFLSAFAQQLKEQIQSGAISQSSADIDASATEPRGEAKRKTRRGGRKRKPSKADEESAA